MEQILEEYKLNAMHTHFTAHSSTFTGVVGDDLLITYQTQKIRDGNSMQREILDKICLYSS